MKNNPFSNTEFVPTPFETLQNAYHYMLNNPRPNVAALRVIVEAQRQLIESK